MAAFMTGGRVAYIWSQELQDVADELPANTGRSSIVHELIRSLGLLKPDAEAAHDHETTGTAEKPQQAVEQETDDHAGRQEQAVDGLAHVIAPDEALGTAEELKRYHDPKYVDHVLAPLPVAVDGENGDAAYAPDPDASDSDSNSSSSSASHYSLRHGRPRKRAKPELHGLENDCPPFRSLARYVQLVAAGTLTACRLLARGDADVAVHLDGGRHHAGRSRASGFCYVADIVLGILLLTCEGKGKGGRRPRVMYLDLDLHYGDGVAQAFHSPTKFHDAGASDQTEGAARPSRRPRAPQVLTLSIHHASPVFFPPSTPLTGLPAASTTSPFSLSIPLHAYPSAATYAALWPAVERVHAAFDPDYVVLQLGADGLAGDRVGQYGAWTTEGEGGMTWCVEQVKRWIRPMCVLGGGGYDHANTARAWALALASLEVSAKADVPNHEHFSAYAPSYTLEISESTVPDENPAAYMDEINKTFEIIAKRIKGIVA